SPPDPTAWLIAVSGARAAPVRLPYRSWRSPADRGGDLPLDRAQGDVGAVVRAGQLDLREPSVRVVARRRQVRPRSDDGQHAPARRHHRAVVTAPGARVQDALALRAGHD